MGSLDVSKSSLQLAVGRKPEAVQVCREVAVTKSWWSARTILELDSHRLIGALHQKTIRLISKQLRRKKRMVANSSAHGVWIGRGLE